MAAGAGRRFKMSAGQKPPRRSVLPKQFLPFDGEPLFMRSVRAFARHPSVEEIVIVHPKGFEGLVRRWVHRLKGRKKILSVKGGAFRGASVRNGVLALSKKIHIILVHDAARPLVTGAIIRRVERAALRNGAALAAWPLPDTLKLSSSSRRVKKTVPRRDLWLAQTPQGFRRDVAIKCLINALPNATDDAALAERRGFKVALVDGASFNLKVTTPEDLKICRALEGVKSQHATFGRRRR